MTTQLVPTLTVEMIHRHTANGRRKPIICSCEEDERNEYYVKLHDALPNGGSVKELVAALVGRRIGLPVPPPVIVHIDPYLLDQMKIGTDGNSQISIGSTAILGSYTAFPGYPLTGEQMLMAQDIFAWDMLIDNADRQSENPNLLFNGEQFAVFDHEGAFPAALFLGAMPPARNLRGRRAVKGHTLYNMIKNSVNSESFDPFFARLVQLDDLFLADVVATVPPEWNGQTLAQQLCDYFGVMRDNHDMLKFELLRTFA